MPYLSREEPPEIAPGLKLVLDSLLFLLFLFVSASVMHLNCITFYILSLLNLKGSCQGRFHLHKDAVKQFCKSQCEN